MALTIGQLIAGRYHIDALVGTGGFGAVYRAHDRQLNRPCALKELVPPPGLSKAQLTQLRHQFRQEASILANLSHPNLPRVTAYFSMGPSDILVMDFIEGESLEDLIQSSGSAVDERQVLLWADQLLSALEYCHAKGVIHRDIKPANVVITKTGQAVIVDFGLVKYWGPAAPHTPVVLRGVATPAYAPPEQYMSASHHTDPRSDIYSLGATLYHALTGKEPATVPQRFLDPDSLKPPAQLNRKLRPQTAMAVERAMDLDKGKRFQSAADMQAALASPQPARQTSVSLPLPVLLVTVAVVALIAVLVTSWAVRGCAAGTPVPSVVLDETEQALLASAPTDTLDLAQMCPTAGPQPSCMPAPTQLPCITCPAEPTPAPLPTYTPYPTYTPWPTGTAVPTWTPPPPAPTNTPFVIVATPTPPPSPTPITDTPEGAVLSLGETWRAKGIELRLTSSGYESRDDCYWAHFELKNETGSRIYVAIDTDQFWITDNLNRRYDAFSRTIHTYEYCASDGYSPPIERELEPGEEVEFSGRDPGFTLMFKGLPVTQPAINLLTVHVADLSRIGHARWQIAIEH